MSKSLNQYASRIAHIVGQSDNQSLKERIKDMIKDYFAKYIIQSIDRNGIQGNYKLSLLITLLGVESSKLTNPLHDVEGDPLRYQYIDFKSTTKIPTPLNIKNDSPFTKVCIPNTAKTFSYTTQVNYRISSTLAPTRCSRMYIFENNTITCKRHIPFNDLQSTELLTQLEVEGLWENPEEVIGFYGITDNQDLEIPFPNEMMSFIISEILKTEFGIIPKDVEITKE